MRQHIRQRLPEGEWWYRFVDNDGHLALFWLLNAVVAVAVRYNSILATAHAAAITLAAIYLTIAGRKSHHVAYITAFVVGSELLWRMSNAAVFYEISKYATAACCLITVARMKQKRLPAAAVVYFLLLVPAAILTAMTMPWTSRLQKMLSFNLSGPLAVAAAICFFSNVRLTQSQIWRIIIILITGIMSVAAVCFFSTQTASQEELAFGSESNKVAAGGFGPNQVSSTLGLAAALILLCLAQRMSVQRRLLLSAGLLICIVQSALTFSRSGLYSAAGSFCAALVFLITDRASRARLAYLGTAGAAVLVFVVLPYLVAFTGGAITKRFSETKLSGREHIVASDIDVWKDNPFYGVGVGVSSFYHERGLASHNEFSRLLAEHGIFGAAAILTLLLFGLHRLMLARSTVERAFVAVMFTWPLLFMMVNGFRIAAPAFVLGLGCVRFEREAPELVRRRRPKPQMDFAHPLEEPYLT